MTRGQLWLSSEVILQQTRKVAAGPSGRGHLSEKPVIRPSGKSPTGNQKTLRRFSIAILEEGGRLGLKCLLLSYFRVGDHTLGTREERVMVPFGECVALLSQVDCSTSGSSETREA